MLVGKTSIRPFLTFNMADNYNFTSQAHHSQDDQIDLKELFLALWKGKWVIILVTMLFAAYGVVNAFSKPNIYKADAILVSANQDGSGGMAAISSQFSGLASLAGINLGGGRDSGAMTLAVLRSRQFLNSFIHKYDLKVPLMAAQKWDEPTDTLHINPEVYDVQSKTWVQKAAPSDWEAYKSFNSLITVSTNRDTGLVTLSITYISPTIAKQWLDWLVVDLNTWIKQESLDKTRRNISYLEEQIQKTSISDMQSVFYQLIEEQTKNLMLAQVQDEFAFKVIDPPVVPEESAGPKRAVSCVLTTLIGGMLGVFIVLVYFVFTKTSLNRKKNMR